MENENIFCVFNKNDYFYSYEKMCRYPWKNGIFVKILRIICNMFSLPVPKFCLIKDIFLAEKIIISDYIFSISLYKRLIKHKSKDHIILYCMNTIDDNNQYMMKYFDKIYTFDKKNSIEYNIKYKHLPYSRHIKLNSTELIYESLFLGRAKNRLEDIIQMKQQLDNISTPNKFLVLDCFQEDLKLENYLSYDEYLQLIAQSKCLVEINKEGQIGCTLRFMEALFFKKKLITNNKAIDEDPYYDKNNVYIIGKDERDLSEFMKSPYIENNQNVEELIFENWIQSF